MTALLVILAWLALDAIIVVGLVLIAWSAAGECSQRSRARRARPVPVEAHYAADNPQHPHPLHEPTLQLEAPDDESAWAALEGRVA